MYEINYGGVWKIMTLTSLSHHLLYHLNDARYCVGKINLSHLYDNTLQKLVVFFFSNILLYQILNDIGVSIPDI